ncbi:MAG: isoprenyl transferase [Acidobacteriota bacterium]
MRKGSEEEELFRQLDLEKIPRHVAIIMDGNGRWAEKRRLPRVAGHRAGIRAVRETVETAARLKLQALTLYAFSMENWKRPASEVATLMKLLKEFLMKELATLMENNIRFETLGRTSELELSVQHHLESAKSKTAKNSGLLFNVALNYGGRAELVDAFRKLAERVRNSNGAALEITEALVSDSLYTAGLPDPDLLIRTSGEMRVSNFLLWQIAYAEIWVTPTLWPDFRRKNFFEALLAYQKRDRRYGGLSAR